MPNQETISPQRQRLRSALAIDSWLQLRSCHMLPTSRVHCECYGQDETLPTIIFLPGIGTYSELYAELLGLIHQQGFNVVALDPPGHGYSSGQRGLYSVEQMCVAVSELIDQLEQQGHSEFLLFGFSIGSLLAVCAAERDNRVQAVLGVTLLLPEIPPDWLHWMGWQWTSSTAWLFPHVTVPLGNLIDFRHLLAGHPAGAEINQDELIIYDYPLKTLASLFSCRTDILRRSFSFRLGILHGDRDEVLPLSYSQQLQQQLCHPAELIVLEKTGHMAAWLAPEKIASQVADWFRAESSV